MAQAIPRTDDQLSAEIAAFASLTTPQLKEHGGRFTGPNRRRGLAAIF
jgi:hypothetical protein